MRAVVGGGEPQSVIGALWRLWREAARWRTVVHASGGPVVLTISLVRGDR